MNKWSFGATPFGDRYSQNRPKHGSFRPGIFGRGIASLYLYQPGQEIQMNRSPGIRRRGTNQVGPDMWVCYAYLGGDVDTYQGLCAAHKHMWWELCHTTGRVYTVSRRTWRAFSPFPRPGRAHLHTHTTPAHAWWRRGRTRAGGAGPPTGRGGRAFSPKNTYIRNHHAVSRGGQISSPPGGGATLASTPRTRAVHVAARHGNH